ncbi:MAG: class I SAM-dependent methyltransferase [Planctomycetota bacterium]
MNPKLYYELAEWWPLISLPADYAEGASRYAQLLTTACHPMLVLELGSGGGNNASHLKKWFDMTLVDLSPHMLEVSRALNPECSHQQGDMRTVRLGTLFDAVFLGDALSYMTSAGDLALAIETAFAHCRPGGAVLFAPDHFRETYCPGVRAGGGDEAGRSVRYLEWNYDPDPTDRTVETDFAFLLRSGSGCGWISARRRGSSPRSTSSNARNPTALSLKRSSAVGLVRLRHLTNRSSCQAAAPRSGA